MITLEILEQQVIFLKEQMLENKKVVEAMSKDLSHYRDLITSQDKSLALLENAFKDMSISINAIQKNLDSQEKSTKMASRFWISFAISTIISLMAVMIALWYGG